MKKQTICPTNGEVITVGKRTKVVKVVTLEGTFPELPTPKMYQQGRGEAGTLKAAFAAAGRDLFKAKGLRGRRLTAFKITVSVGTREVEVDE